MFIRIGLFGFCKSGDSISFSIVPITINKKHRSLVRITKFYDGKYDIELFFLKVKRR